MKLADIPEHAFTLDVRIGRALAADLRTDAAAYSLWPEAPFGASADNGIWPSAFAVADTAGPSQIPMRAGESVDWDALQRWQSLEAMGKFILPTDPAGEIIALGMDRSYISAIPEDTVTRYLCDNELDQAAKQADVQLLGYDITDIWLQSALFDWMHDATMQATAPPRSVAGLIAARDDARRIRANSISTAEALVRFGCPSG